MKTEIFKSYYDFTCRENKKINGVSEDFAKENPNYVLENETNNACWNCRSCRSCSYCSSCIDCSYCIDCSSCIDCSDCSDCSYCSDCSDCSSCINCSDKKEDESLKLIIPKIENIHQKNLEATSKKGALQMADIKKCADAEIELNKSKQ